MSDLCKPRVLLPQHHVSQPYVSYIPASHGLNVNCLPQVPVLDAWSEPGGAIWGDHGKIRGWGLAAGSRSLG